MYVYILLEEIEYDMSKKRLQNGMFRMLQRHQATQCHGVRQVSAKTELRHQRHRRFSSAGALGDEEVQPW